MSDSTSLYLHVKDDGMDKVTVLGAVIAYYQKNEQDYISLTDMVKNFGDDTMIYSWMRNRNTLEFIGIWEELHNPSFNSNEFVTFKSQAGLNSFNLTPRNMALFGITAKDWRDKNPGRKGNIRDDADVSQLVCLSNLENLNALFIQGARTSGGTACQVKPDCHPSNETAYGCSIMHQKA